MNLIALLKDGQEYIKICSKDDYLKATFPEIKIIALTRLGIHFIPPFVMVIFVWQYYMHAPLIASILTVIFALSLPIQGILWLGKRSRMPLPLTLITWFNELKEQLILHRILGKKVSITPTYMELMKLLQMTKKYINHEETNRHDLTPPSKKEANNREKKRK